MLDTIPEKIHFDEKNLYITWKDGKDCAYDLLNLRRMCPCAHCRGGHEVTSQRITGDITEIRMSAFHKIGRYAIAIVWSDGHNDGIYTYDTLRESCDLGIPYAPRGEQAV